MFDERSEEEEEEEWLEDATTATRKNLLFLLLGAHHPSIHSHSSVHSGIYAPLQRGFVPLLVHFVWRFELLIEDTFASPFSSSMKQYLLHSAIL